jgi:hypothetical protein
MMMKLLLALLLAPPWIAYTSPSGNTIGSFIMEEPWSATGENNRSLILVCSGIPSKQLHCHDAIPFPTPEGLK